MPSITRKIKTLPKDFAFIVMLVLALAFAVALAVFAYLGFFSRYMADDYCHSSLFAQSGNLLNAIVHWYTGSSNRFMIMFLVGVSEWFGHSAISYLPALVVLFWCIGLTWMLSQILVMLRVSRPRLLALVLAGMVICFALWLAPNRYQILYWRSGLASYLVPIATFPYLFGRILYEVRQPLHSKTWVASIVILALGFFLVGGFSETTVALQTGVLALSLGLTWILVKSQTGRKARLLLIVALVASLLAMAVVILSPANKARQRSFPEPPGLVTLVLMSLQFAWEFTRESFEGLYLPLFLTLAMSLLVGYILRMEEILPRKGKHWPFVLASVPIIGFLLVVCSIAPNAYGESMYPAERTLFPARFVIVLTLVGLGFLTGLALQRWNKVSCSEKAGRITLIVSLILLLTMASYPLHIANRLYAFVPRYHARAEAWDARDLQIREAKQQGMMIIEVQELDSIGGIKEIGPVKHWVNRCAARFYGVEYIWAYP